MSLAAFLAMAPHCAPSVDADTLASVVQTESKFHLYGVGINQGGRQIASRTYASKEEAVAAVAVLIARGIDNLDIGPAQISWRAGHLQRRGLTPADAFDPCTALRIANDALLDCWNRALAREEQTRLDQMAACYNSGTFERPGYVRAVRASAAVVVPAIRIQAAATRLAASSSAPPLAAAPPSPRQFATAFGRRQPGRTVTYGGR